jgi:hypothetical protein
MNFGSFLRGPKDAAIALGVRSFFNARYSRFGQMSDMSIDTARREIRLRLDLVGESTPVEIHLTNYSIQHQGERTTMTIGDATASREWITELLRQFVVGRPFVLPEGAGAIVTLLL